MVTESHEGPTVGRNRVVVEEAGDDLLQHCPWAGMASCIRRRSSSLISLSLARTRSRRDFLLTRKPPRRDLPQMKVKPRKLKVSGLPSPLLSRFAAAWRPNSPGFRRLVPPPMQQRQQHIRVGGLFLQGMPRQSRHNPADQPSRQAHFDDCDQRAILLKDGEGPAQIVCIVHGALHRSALSSDDGAISSPPAP